MIGVTTANTSQLMSSKTLLYRRMALSSHILLIAWMLLWYFVLSAEQKYSVVFILLVNIVPLLLPLHGIIKAKPYTHAWACFIVLWYLLHSITTLYAEPQDWWFAGIVLLLSSVMFVACSMFARLRGKELGTHLPKLSKVMADEKAIFEKD